MKKIVISMLLILSLAVMLASCGSITCDICKQEKSGSKNEATIGSKTYVYCEDCNDKIEELQKLGDSVGDAVEDIGNALGNLGDAIGDAFGK